MQIILQNQKGTTQVASPISQQTMGLMLVAMGVVLLLTAKR